MSNLLLQSHDFGIAKQGKKEAQLESAPVAKRKSKLDSLDELIAQREQNNDKCWC